MVLAAALPGRAQSPASAANAAARAARATPVAPAIASPQISDADIARAVRRHGQPVLPVDTPTRAAGPRLDALPQPLAGAAPLDLGALARGFDAAAAAPGQGIAGGPQLLVFVSFSMPERTWQRLLDQAERARATLLLRGFVEGSLRQTVLHMQQRIGQRRVAVQIDPQAFERHAVTAVPTVVLLPRGHDADVKPGRCMSATCGVDAPGGAVSQNGTPSPDPGRASGAIQASGDVSLDHVLRQFIAADPAVARDAREFLTRLGGGLR